jgi:hypothetical protein
MSLLRSRSLASLAFLAAALVPSLASAQIFKETWENGGARWTNNPPLVSDASATKTFQRETVNTGGGRVATVQAIAVQPSTKYCLASWIRGTANAGTSPFIGIQTNVTEHWLIGGTVFADSYGGLVTPVVSDGAWHWYAREFTTTAAETSLQIKDEKYQGSAVATADFDDIELYLGACPATPRNVPNENTFCAGTKPIVDLAANACLGCAGDNGPAGATCAAATPFCAADGSCGKCGADADCAGHAGGKFCSAATGACSNYCEKDAQCGAGNYCDPSGFAGGACMPQAANGAPIPGNVCTPAAAVSGCLSGVCDVGSKTCGSKAGGPCTTDAQCTEGVCDAATKVCKLPVVDAGVPDAGPLDAGSVDAGPVDSGVKDASADATAADAGKDSGSSTDAGNTTDAGATADAGTPTDGDDAGGGCSCDAASAGGTGGTGLLVALTAMIGARLRRKRA